MPQSTPFSGIKVLARHSCVGTLRLLPEWRCVCIRWLAQQRLDDVGAGDTAQAQNIYLRVGTQVFEFAAAGGESELLAICCSGQLERTFVPLYGSQKLWIYFLDTMRAQGFGPLAALTWLDPAMERALQTDAIFSLH